MSFEFDPSEFDSETLAIRAGFERSQHGEHSEPVYLTSSYIFNSAEDAAARFRGDAEGPVYARYTNPTVNLFESRLAALEGGEESVATSSGMAAILSACMAFLSAGDEVLCSADVFGSTTGLFSNYMAKFGVKTHYLPLGDLGAWEAAANENTKLLFLETPSNPLCRVADIRAFADLAERVGARLAVDNCFCTPALQQPLLHGAHMVIHSATKYLDGQGRTLGGAVVGTHADMAQVRAFLRTCGPTMSPFNAWVFLKGLETLSLRMERHCANAQGLAEWLSQQDEVTTVNYAGLEQHPGHALAAQQQSGFGGVLSFTVRGGREAAWACINGVRWLSLTSNLGDAKTTIVHPATTTHGRLSDQEREAAGITENLIRISVGLESLKDIQDDLKRGLSCILAG